MSNWTHLDRLERELRLSVRRLARSPEFALIAILVMALGIGAATSLFTIVRSVLLKPLPFREPDKLVMLYEHLHGATTQDSEVSPADFRDWRQQTHGFEDMAAWRIDGFNLTGVHAELPEVVEAAGGSWNLFSLLGVQLPLGRSFTEDEDRPGGNRVVLLTWSLFQRRFGGDAAILGQQIQLDTNPYTIVGVLPRWFNYPTPHVQLWVPYGSTFEPAGYGAHEDRQSRVVARLGSGISAAAAIKPVSALQYQLHLENAAKPVAEEVHFKPMIEDVVQDVKTPLLVLLGAVGCMLLIACLNVSNLLIARAAARRKEIAVRSALGGSRLTLIAEQMTESVLICVAGGSLGVIFSLLATRWLAKHWRALPRADAIHMDGTVLTFSIAIAFLAALLAGLLPAVFSTGGRVLAALQESSRSVSGSLTRSLLRKALLITEITLTVILLISAGLLFKNFLRLRTSDLGCATENVLTMKFGLPEKQYDTREKVIAFHQALLAGIRRLPGVRAAGLVSTPPAGGYEGDTLFSIPGKPANSGYRLQDDALYRTADPGYFNALQIPLISGRFFTDQERLNRDHYIVVSKKFARQFFPGENPLQRLINVNWNGKPENYEIIGVVGDTLYDVAKPVKATVYFPILSGIPDQTSGATIVVRTEGEALALSLPVQKQIAALDSAIPVYEVFTIQEILSRTTASQSFSSTLLLAFASLSLLLAASGLYGMLSYLVTQRVSEIGVRMALGAQRIAVLRMMLLAGLRPVVIGLGAGLAGGAAAGVLIRSQLYGMSSLDPEVFATMVGILLLTAVVACVVPAIRASRIEPIQALRAE
jgi:predicted permease